MPIKPDPKPGDPEMGGYRSYIYFDSPTADAFPDSKETRESLMERQFDGLRTPQRQAPVNLLGTYSCNCYGEVWRPTGRGYTRHHNRVPLEGKNALLDCVVAVLLKHYPDGGRFCIKAISNSEYGTVMVRNERVVCKLPRR